jgi:hypothetical protein
MKVAKYIMPPAVFSTVLGAGVYLALLLNGDGSRGAGALIIAVSASSILATVGFIWSAFKLELFRRRPRAWDD